MKSERILLITWNFPPKKGGMENLIYDIYTHLSLNYETEVIAPCCHQKETARIYRPKRKGFLYFAIYSVIKAASLKRNKKYDFVFGGSLAVLPILIILKILLKAKYVAYVHGLDVIYNNAFYQLILKTCTPFMNGFVCNSRNTKALLTQRFKNLKNTTVIPPGMHAEKFPAQSARPYPRKYILSVGRLTSRKGLIPFVENCFLYISKQFPDVDFLITGSEPKEAMYHKCGYEQQLRQCIKKNGLEKRVFLLGWVENDQKLALYQHCECAVFPVVPLENDVEGFGMVAIEAGIMGRPTVAFNVGGIGDAIIDGKTGTLIDSDDYPQMTGEIKKILQKQKYTNHDAIHKEVKRHYSWDKLLTRYDNFLHRIQ